MPEHIYVQIDNEGESVVLAARNGIVIFKHQAVMTPQHVRKLVGQIASKIPDAEIHEISYDGGFRQSEKLRNVREWDEAWKEVDPDKLTSDQLTPDNERVEEGDDPSPTVDPRNQLDIDTSPPDHAD